MSEDKTMSGKVMADIHRVLEGAIHPDVADLFESALERLKELLEFSEGISEGYIVRHGDLMYMTPKALDEIERAGL